MSDDWSACGLCGEPIVAECVPVGLTILNLCADCLASLREAESGEMGYSIGRTDKRETPQDTKDTVGV